MLSTPVSNLKEVPHVSDRTKPPIRFSGFAAEKKPPANAVPVRVSVVEERIISEQTAIIGSTEPVRQSTVAAEISGRVEAFYVKAGDFVKKDSIAMTIVSLKGKSEIRIHRGVLKTKSALFGRSFWAHGYCVSTVGLDEVTSQKVGANPLV